MMAETLPNTAANSNAEINKIITVTAKSNKQRSENKLMNKALEKNLPAHRLEMSFRYYGKSKFIRHNFHGSCGISNTQPKTLQTNCYKLSILPAWPENTCIYIVFLVEENAVQIVGGSFRVRLKIFSRQEFFFD